MMTFHESYGELPKSTLTLIKRHKVTVAEYDLMTIIKGWSFDEVDRHIKDNLRNGVYMAPLFL